MSLAVFTWIDFAVAIVLLLSAGFALARGLVSSVLGFAGWVAAAYLAIGYAETLAKHFPANLFGEVANHGMLNVALAFALIFIVTIILVTALGGLLARLMQTIGLSPVDRILGLAFGVLRGGVLVLVLAVALELLGFANYPAWGNSVTRPLADRTLSYLLPFLPKKLTHRLSH